MKQFLNTHIRRIKKFFKGVSFIASCIGFQYVTVKGLTKAFSCHIFAGGKHNRKHKAYGLQKDCMHRHKTVEWETTYGQNSGYPSYYLTGNPKTSTCARCTDGTAGPCRTSPPSSARPRAKCFPPFREAAGSSAYSWSIPSIHIHYGNRYRVLES